MNLQLVTGKPFECRCYRCRKYFDSAKMVADLDGPAFQAYYCPDCAKAVAAPEPADDGNLCADETHDLDDEGVCNSPTCTSKGFAP